MGLISILTSVLMLSVAKLLSAQVCGEDIAKPTISFQGSLRTWLEGAFHSGGMTSPCHMH